MTVDCPNVSGHADSPCKDITHSVSASVRNASTAGCAVNSYPYVSGNVESVCGDFMVSDSESGESFVIPVIERLCSNSEWTDDGDLHKHMSNPISGEMQTMQSDACSLDVNEVELDSSTGITVAKSKSNSRQNRTWDKRDFCKFCHKSQAKLIRHMMLKHSDEIEVSMFMAQPLKSKQRLLLQQKLRNDGNYEHNVDVLKNDSGVIVPFRRPCSSRSSVDFLPCEFCHAMFVKHNLWRHVKTCPFKHSASSDGHNRRQGSSSLLLPFSTEASSGLKRDIMSGMNQDDVTAAVRVDDLIMKFGSRLHFKHGHLKHRFAYIKERIRQLGRFLLQMRRTSAVTCLSDCLDPQQFQSVVSAVRSVCGFDEEKHIYKTPSLALKLGHSLKECTRIQAIL